MYMCHVYVSYICVMYMCHGSIDVASLYDSRVSLRLFWQCSTVFFPFYCKIIKLHSSYFRNYVDSFKKCIPPFYIQLYTTYTKSWENFDLRQSLCVCFVDRCLSCTFSFDHCVVYSSIYGFWLPLWCLKTLHM